MGKIIMTFEGYKQYRLREKHRKQRKEEGEIPKIRPEQAELKNSPDLTMTPEC
jgi:hypothetical protein